MTSLKGGFIDVKTKQKKNKKLGKPQGSTENKCRARVQTQSQLHNFTYGIA